MRLSLRYICLFLALMASPCFAQTSTDLSSKYVAPVQSYEIRPGIFMAAKYTNDGQVCEMSVEKRHIQTGKIALDTDFSLEERKWIVDELAPAANRGKKCEDVSCGLIDVSGMVMTELEEYENVRITYYSKYTKTKKMPIARTVVIVIVWKNRPCKQG